MARELVKFHLKCVKEHLEILDTFNILYYGFGCKKNILSKMYPEAQQFDMNFYKLNDIIYELNIKLKKKHKNITDFKENIILILINFDFKLANHFIKSSFRLIFTLDKINTDLTYKNLTDLNIVMRDLTTYEDYEYSLINNSDDKIDGYLNVIRNGSKNSKFTFKNLLQFYKSTVSLTELFDKIKKILMIVKKNLIYNYLGEFIDHNMIKIRDNQFIDILVDKVYYEKLIVECDK